jgi:membrane-associated phospholipid phosphatase
VTPNARPFSATDPDISFPFQTKTKIPTWLLVVCSVIIPGGVIAVLALGAPNAQSYTTAQGWKRRFYCLNTAWLGLGLSLATAILITNGVKNLVGRPRPDLLSRCQFNQSEIQQFTVGQNQLLDWHICKGSNETVSSVSGVTTGPDIRDGFRSFPSGHCSSASASVLSSD